MEIAAEHVRRTFLPDIPNPKLTAVYAMRRAKLEVSNKSRIGRRAEGQKDGGGGVVTNTMTPREESDGTFQSA